MLYMGKPKLGLINILGYILLAALVAAGGITIVSQIVKLVNG